MEVIIMRGLPGSGKSFWVGKVRHPRDVVCSADDSHVEDDGVYRYKPERAGAAHLACYVKFLKTLQAHEFALDPPRVFVDNTNTTAWEIAPYYQAALALGASPKIVWVLCDLLKAHRRGTHQVPYGKLLVMNHNLYSDLLPPHWRVEYVDGD